MEERLTLCNGLVAEVSKVVTVRTIPGRMEVDVSKQLICFL